MDINKILYEKNGIIQEFIPSHEQKEVFNEVVYGINNIVINASAGSGKTSTIVNALRLIPENLKVIFLAYNKDIVIELQKRIGNRKNIKVMTSHSLGYSMLLSHFEDDKTLLQLDEFKYKSHLNNNLSDYTTNNIDEMGIIKFKTYINTIKSLVDLSRYNFAQSEKEIIEVAKKYGYDNILIDDECSIVKKLLKWGYENIETIDFTDMIWLPTELSIPTRKFQYDWIICDEIQDFSIIQQKLFQKCFKRGTRFIGVGDTFQCINAYVGSDPAAFNNLTQYPNTKLFKLPISYRCPKKIVDLAKKLSPNIEYSPKAIDGMVLYNVKPNDPKLGDMVLCRNTSPLVSLYMMYLRNNKKCYIRGKNIGNNLISLMELTNKKLLNKTLVSDGVIVRLYEMILKQREQIMNNFGLSIEDASNTSQISYLYDSIKSIEVLSEGVSTYEELCNKIKAIFIDSDGEGVCLSTIHKSKGLESDNVYILCPSLIPSKLAKYDWEMEAEKNLEYVAITRAKKKLMYISEKDFPPTGGLSNVSIMIKDLEKIEEKISNIVQLHSSNSNDKNIQNNQTLINKTNIYNKENKRLNKIKKFMQNEKI